ncbi:MAG: hypothetical protein WCJ85_12385 [Chitinophagaceae bacterium]
MKHFFIPIFSLMSLASMAQTPVISQAIITTKTNIIVSENDDDSPGPMQGPNGEEVRIMRMGGEGETKSTTTLKADFVKTFSESEMGRNTVIRDNKNKKTTTLIEMMGNKMGFYATDEEDEQMKKEMDSMMKSQKNDGSMIIMGDPVNAGESTYEVVNVEGAKKIAGYDCKKALIIRTGSNAKKDTSIVWYNPAFKLQGLASTGGGGGGFGGFARSSNSGAGFDKLDGFPMQYETTLGRGRKMKVEVTKIVTDKEIADKEFEIPKDFDVKSAKEMRNFGPGGGRGGVQIRMNN